MCQASVRYFCGCITAPAPCSSYSPTSWPISPCNKLAPHILHNTTCGRSGCAAAFPAIPRFNPKTVAKEPLHRPGECSLCKCTAAGFKADSSRKSGPSGARNSMAVKAAQIKADGKLAESISTEEGYYDRLVEMTKAEFSRGKAKSSSSSRHHSSSSSSRPSSSRRHESSKSSSSLSKSSSSSRHHESESSRRRESESSRHHSSSSSSRPSSVRRHESSKSSSSSSRPSSISRDGYVSEASKSSKSSRASSSAAASLVSSSTPRCQPLALSRSPKSASAAPSRCHSIRENDPEVMGLDRFPEDEDLPGLEAGGFQENLDAVVAQMEQMEFDRLTRAEDANCVDRYDESDHDNEGWTHRVAGKNPMSRLSTEPGVSRGASRHVAFDRHSDIHSMAGEVVGGDDSDGHSKSRSIAQKAKNIFRTNRGGGEGLHDHRYHRRNSYGSDVSYSSYGSIDSPSLYPPPLYASNGDAHRGYRETRHRHDDRHRSTRHEERPRHKRSRSHGDRPHHHHHHHHHGNSSTRHHDSHREDRHRHERRRSRSRHRDTRSRDDKSHDKSTRRSKHTREKSTHRSSRRETKDRRRDDDKHRESKTSGNKGLGSFLSGVFGRSSKNGGSSRSRSRSKSKTTKHRSDGYFNRRSLSRFRSRHGSSNDSEESFGCIDSNLISSGQQPRAAVYARGRGVPAPIYINGTDSVVYEQENNAGMYSEYGYHDGPDVAGNNWI